MIRRLLIANRGEIALRIVRACRELGIESIAVYSDVDALAPHVLAADRAVAIGPAPASDSYLSIARIVDAARGSGADAVHPGYGFLSENAAFASACAEAGLAFVGPPAEAMARMGSKIEARRIAAEAGAPIVPGETPTDQSNAGVRTAIDRVGLPALIKASAGGGGTRHADRARRQRRRLSDRRRATRSLGGIRRRDAVRRASHRRRAARRDPGVRGQPRQRGPSVRARLLGAAAAPESPRGESLACADRRPACADDRCGRRRRARRGVSQRRHARVPRLGRAASTSWK